MPRASALHTPLCLPACGRAGSACRLGRFRWLNRALSVVLGRTSRYVGQPSRKNRRYSLPAPTHDIRIRSCRRTYALHLELLISTRFLVGTITLGAFNLVVLKEPCQPHRRHPILYSAAMIPSSPEHDKSHTIFKSAWLFERKSLRHGTPPDCVAVEDVKMALEEIPRNIKGFDPFRRLVRPV